MSSYRVGLLDLLRSNQSGLTGEGEEHEGEEVKQRVRRFSFFIGSFIFVIDLSTAFCFFGVFNGWNTSNMLQPIKHFPSSLSGQFTHGSFDCLLLAILRALILPLLGACAIRYGQPRYKKLVVDRGNQRRSTRLNGYTSINNKSNGDTNPNHSSDPIQYIALEGKADVQRAVLIQGLELNNAGAVATLQATDKARQKLKKQATCRKHFFLSLLFVISSTFSVYIGIKCLEFRFSIKGSKVVQAVTMCISALWVNIAVWIIRAFVEEETRERGLLLPNVHPHPVFFDSNAICHWCDLCSTRIQKAWRCKLCDFDICVKCASRKDAAVVGENMLRSDSGTRNENTMTNKEYLKRAFKLALPEWRWMLLAVLFLIGTSIATLVLPNSQGLIVQDIIKSSKDDFNKHVKTYIIVMVLLGIFNGIKGLAFTMVGRKIAFHARNKLYKSLLIQDIAYFDGTTSGRLTSRLTNDVGMMMSPIQSTLSTLLFNIIMLIGGIVMCFYESYQLSMLAFTSVGPILVLSALAEANSCATQALGNIRIVKSFSNEKKELKEYMNSTEESLKQGIRDAWGYALTSAITNYLDLGTGMLILSVGGLLCIRHQENPDQDFGIVRVKNLIAFQLYWNYMNSAYQALQGVITGFTRSAAAAERVFSLMDSLPDINPSEGAPINWIVKGEIEFKNVNFYYQMRPDQKVLQDISFKIPAGKVVAFVGRSGGGKSTIVNMIQRFYDPRGGAILFDGRDLRDICVSELRSLIGAVAQDTSLFAKTIAENIVYGAVPGSYTQEDIVNAAKNACAHDFIVDFRDGYNTRVGERGLRISGGQRQRIALARVFLRKPKVLLLDEATSALDAESESLVQNAIDRLIAKGVNNSNGSTVVLVAHRLSTVINADVIAVVDKGKIVEYGSHEELIARGGIYSMLVEKQIAKKNALIDTDGINEEVIASTDNVDKLLDALDQETKK